MALSAEYLQYADNLFAESRNVRHQEMLEQIALQNQTFEYIAIVGVIMIIGLLGWLFWIAVDNQISYQVADDFERITPPPINWDNVDINTL